MTIRSTLLLALTIAACGPNSVPAPGTECDFDSDCPSGLCDPNGICVEPTDCIANPSLPECQTPDGPVAAEFEVFAQDNGAISGGLVFNDAELDPYLVTEDAYYDDASTIGCHDISLPPFFQNTIANNAAGGVHLGDGTASIDGTQDQDGFYELFAAAGTFPADDGLDLTIDGSAEVDATTLQDVVKTPHGPIVVHGSIDANNNLALTDEVAIDPIPDADQVRIAFNILENGQPTTISCGIDPAIGTADISGVRSRLGGGGSMFIEVRTNARFGVTVGGNDRSLEAKLIHSKSQGFINNP